MNRASVLIVDDEELLAIALHGALDDPLEDGNGSIQCDVEIALTRERARDKISSRAWDILAVDLCMRSSHFNDECLQFLKDLRAAHPRPMIIMTGKMPDVEVYNPLQQLEITTFLSKTQTGLAERFRNEVLRALRKQPALGVDIHWLAILWVVQFEGTVFKTQEEIANCVTRDPRVQKLLDKLGRQLRHIEVKPLCKDINNLLTHNPPLLHKGKDGYHITDEGKKMLAHSIGDFSPQNFS